MHLLAPSVLLALAALPASTAAWSWHGAGSSESSAGSNSLNGVPVELAFQHQLTKDFAALGWDIPQPIGSQSDPEEAGDAEAEVEAGPDADGVRASVNGHTSRMRRAAKKATAAPAKYQSGRKVRGVNIGSWLVTEPWMVPSLYVGPFKAHPSTPILDEYTLCQAMGRAWCTKTLAAHYASFITEKDFAAIAAAGLNHVRIPVGYWAFDVSLLGD